VHNVLLNMASSGHATSGHVTDVTSGHVTSGYVTSGGSTTWIHHKCGFVRSHILLVCIMISIIAFLVIKLFSWLYVRVGILLTCERIISRRREVWVHNTSLAPPLCY
jgi:hypothetical protein